jgi:hypothetical protein
MKTEGLLSKNGPRKGIGDLGPSDLRWTARIRWRGKKEGATARVGGGDGDSAISGGEEHAGVDEQGSTDLDFQFRGHGGESGAMATSTQHLTPVGKEYDAVATWKVLMARGGWIAFSNFLQRQAKQVYQYNK